MRKLENYIGSRTGGQLALVLVLLGVVTFAFGIAIGGALRQTLAVVVA